MTATPVVQRIPGSSARCIALKAGRIRACFVTPTFSTLNPLEKREASKLQARTLVL